MQDVRSKMQQTCVFFTNETNHTYTTRTNVLLLPVAVQVLDAGGVETTAPPDDAMHDVAFGQQELRKVGAILRRVQGFAYLPRLGTFMSVRRHSPTCPVIPVTKAVLPHNGMVDRSPLVRCRIVPSRHACIGKSPHANSCH